jgi:hypothetical protein
MSTTLARHLLFQGFEYLFQSACLKDFAPWAAVVIGPANKAHLTVGNFQPGDVSIGEGTATCVEVAGQGILDSLGCPFLCAQFFFEVLEVSR